MWARKQMNDWSQEASFIKEERKKQAVSQDAETDTNKDAVGSSHLESSSSSESSSSDSSLWMKNKAETVRKLSGVLSSLVYPK